MQHWVQVFRDILDEDSFLPIHVYFYNIIEGFVMLFTIIFYIYILGHNTRRI